MAAIPKSLAETGRRDSANSQRKGATLSHGRGGAGNMGTSSATSLSPEDFATPTLKSDMYTTGRGGSGNMAKNENAEEARRAQDVVGHPRRESASNTHVGRGGAANIFKPSAAELEGAKKDGAKWESAIGDEGSEDGRTGLVGANGKANGGGVGKGGVNGTGKGDEDRSKGLADRGKEWLMGKFGK